MSNWKIDLIAQDANRMLLVECKDKVDDTEQLMTQLDRLRHIAAAVGAEVRFATLDIVTPPHSHTLHLNPT